MKKIAMFAYASVMAFSAVAESVDIPDEMLPIIRAAEIATDWTLPELKAGLDRLDRLYQNDMASAEGRRRWHGAVTNTVFDTNALVKVQVHADGWRFEQSFDSARAMGVDERISATERKARAEAAARARAEADARRNAERIALLQTNLVAETSKLMHQKKWPEELARLYLLNELNTLVGTQTVNAVVGPQ